MTLVHYVVDCCGLGWGPREGFTCGNPSQRMFLVTTSLYTKWVPRAIRESTLENIGKVPWSKARVASYWTPQRRISRREAQEWFLTVRKELVLLVSEDLSRIVPLFRVWPLSAMNLLPLRPCRHRISNPQQLRALVVRDACDLRYAKYAYEGRA